MPRATKRKASQPLTSSDVDSPVVRTGRVRTAHTKQMKLLDRIDSLFETYANRSLDLIDPEGIEILCADLGVDYTDVRILMLAWKMKASKQGYFSKDEWRTGLKPSGIDTITKLKKALTALEKEVMNPEHFEDFYAFAFRYCLTEDKQRNVDIETVCALLNLVLKSQFGTQVDLLVEFLKIQKDYKTITMDQWKNFYRFFKETNFSDLQNYDCNLAWPLILDNFVEWLKGRQS